MEPARPTGARVVDAGGHRLEIRCEGQGLPVVALENGGFPVMDPFGDLKREIARTWRVCSYDRAGTGKSEPGPDPRDARQIARELHALLTNAGEPAPYVLVSWSAGALYTPVYASAYAEHVAGIVFVEPRTAAYHRAAPVRVEPQLAAAAAALPPAYGQEFAAWDASAAQVEAAPLPDVPVVVLTAASPEAIAAFAERGEDFALWRATHEQLAASARTGKHVVDDAEHVMWQRNPAAIVDAIRWVVEQRP